MLSVQRANFLIVVVAKIILAGDANARCAPHIGYIKVFASVIIEIEPRNAHSGAHIFDAGLLWRHR